MTSADSLAKTLVDLTDEQGAILHPAGTEVRIIEEIADRAGVYMIEIRIEDNRLAAGARYEVFELAADQLDPDPSG